MPGIPANRPRIWEIVAKELCARGLDTRFAKALESLPDENHLIVRASFGWTPNTVEYLFA
jgi:hypothetical protein